MGKQLLSSIGKQLFETRIIPYWFHGYCGDWYGVKCFNGSVNRLNITNDGVIGTLYDFSFSSLPFLEYVGLSINQLYDTIPPAIENLTNLVYLDLSANQFSGIIPPQIGSLTKLGPSSSLTTN
ncbi:hypothetical protein HAX54_024443 [Datura stramonium]|uniref:Uncharacterized protein n=1 Tax=Datura stramonium TaxID=4076 RepID=A0ABS8S5R9_DATST|nr:hypothetical protein [Datura stramonium]